MNVYRSFEEVAYDSDTILTVGTFDGMHLGHQSIVEELLSQSKNYHLRNFLLTFHPHPQQIIKKKNRDEISLLTTIDERLVLIEKFGVENVLIIPFTMEFSQISHEVFVRDYLYKKIGMKKILVGYDHMFGKNREGNKETLMSLGTELGFEVINMNAMENKNFVISSTKIRLAIKDKNIALANEMLGYEYRAGGMVVSGDMRGRTIGFPTANVELSDKYKLLPGDGVYCTRVRLGTESFFGMTNIGTRPTFGENNQRTFETYIFDFDRDIYGETIFIEFIDFIRDELKFDSVEKLISAIRQDEVKCKEIISGLQK